MISQGGERMCKKDEVQLSMALLGPAGAWSPWLRLIAHPVIMWDLI